MLNLESIDKINVNDDIKITLTTEEADEAITITLNKKDAWALSKGIRAHLRYRKT